MAPIDWDCLLPLLKASSKSHVLDLCSQAYEYRNIISVPAEAINAAKDKLNCDDVEAQKILVALSSLIKLVLNQKQLTHDSVSGAFPDSFHRQLRDLLVNTMVDNVDSWASNSERSNLSKSKRKRKWKDVHYLYAESSRGSSALLSSAASMSLLRDFRYAINVSGEEPTCDLDVEYLQEGAPNRVTLQLTASTLNEMITGMSRIRDQLFSAAAKK